MSWREYVDARYQLIAEYWEGLLSYPAYLQARYDLDRIYYP